MSEGPSAAEIDVAVDEVKGELESSEMIDQIEITDIPDEEIIKRSKRKLVGSVTDNRPETINAKVGPLLVKVYLADELSVNDWYVLVESTKDSEVLVIVNTEHPHWLQLKASEGVANYLRHSIYDAIAEWKAKKITSKLDPDTIKIIKDGLLRVSFWIEKHQTGNDE